MPEQAEPSFLDRPAPLTESLTLATSNPGPEKRCNHRPATQTGPHV